MMTAGQALTGSATPMAGAANGTSGTTGTSGSSGADSSDDSSSSATISANDFLTLLVTEMQNQDPTADTDPNEYINQLVQVNSLEQLIDINQTLSGALGSATPSSTTGASSQVAGGKTGAAATSPLTASAASTAHTQAAPPAAASAVPAARAQTTAARHTAGNVSVPGVNAAAQRVGHALSGRTRARPAKGSAIPLQ
jgi:flagellar basal-body rod modification protein FlgD